MKHTTLTAALLCAAASLWASVPNDATLVRLPAMPKSPVIDGKIDYNEWQFASTSFGGVSNLSGLMTRRENDFRIGFDAENLYFAITSEMPVPPQTLTEADKVEFRIVPPQGKETKIVIDPEGKGTIPGGVKFKSVFAPALLNRFRNKCWTIEVAVPLASLGVSKFTDGEEWKIQMMRHWSSEQETGFWHYTKKGKGAEYATFIPDSAAPAVSFDGFGYNSYEATGNYQFTYRMENGGKTPMKLVSGCFMLGSLGVATIDINNPDFMSKTEKITIGVVQESGGSKKDTVVQPGKTGYFRNFLMAMFAGQVRMLYSRITDDRGNLYYQRNFSWDVNKAINTADYKDKLGLPYLNAAFFPSYGKLLRVAGCFRKQLPIISAKIELKDGKGKVLWQISKSDFGRPLPSFEVEQRFPDLALGDYTVTLTSTDANWKKYVHSRTFSLRKFPWQNQNIGKERVIIPPFKPLQLDKEAKTVKALLTGYKLGGGGLWSEVYAEGENILASPVGFCFNGKMIVPGVPKLISAEPDRIVYESSAEVGGVKFTFIQDYDYDGFCKVTVKAFPSRPVKVSDFGYKVALKDGIVKYCNSVGKLGARAGNAPDLTIPKGEGKLTPNGVAPRTGNVLFYLWMGGIYKGFCWMIDTPRNCSLLPKVNSWDLTRKDGAVIFRQFLVNKPVEWTKPLEWVVGFEPTPVKPRNKQYLQIGDHMYSYDPPKGSDHASCVGCNEIVPELDYPVNTLPNNDESFFKFLFSTRNRIPSKEERIKFANDYFARNEAWIDRYAPLTDKTRTRNALTEYRCYGKKYFLHYQLPTLYSAKWPEAEMYKAEWSPWNFPVDDAANEYFCNQTTEHTDFMLYFMRQQARWGYDGMNFDTFPLGGGFNDVTGNGVRPANSAAPVPVPFLTNANMFRTCEYEVMEGKNLFGWRELMKRTATMLYMEKKLVYGTPWVDLHATECQCVPMTAFCSTMMNCERSSEGDQYFARFPQGYLLGDMLGTQSGVVPQTIFSTHSQKLPPAEQVKSMIAFSFANGTMNHLDQGVSPNRPEYRKARDIVFTFGYGKPQNKTLCYYDHEEQPVKFASPQVYSTQVIRPDGMTLLMIGNSGREVKTKFDAAKLGYGKMKITDLYHGDSLSVPEITLEEHGYALLLLENVNPEQKGGSEMNKKQFLSALVGAGALLAATGEEVKFDKAEQWCTRYSGASVAGRNGAIELKGMVEVRTREAVKNEAGKKYTLSALFKTADKSAPLFLCYICYDEKGREIPAVRYATLPDSMTTLVKPTKPEDTKIVVKAHPKWKKDPYRDFAVAFNAKADESDLPNSQVSAPIKAVEKAGENLIVTLHKPIVAEIPAGTPVRLHRQLAFFCPADQVNGWVYPNAQGKLAKGSFTIPPAIKTFRPAAVMYDQKNNSVEMSDCKLVIE